MGGGDKYKKKGTGGAKNSVTIKVGMVGDSEVGKTSLMVKYVENKFDEDYICTLGTPRSRRNKRNKNNIYLCPLNTFILFLDFVIYLGLP